MKFKWYFHWLKYIFYRKICKTSNELCGAYGLPLAAQIKRQGKQAIHIGGGLQLLFGIRGRRWDEMDSFKGFFNEAWVYPDNRERPKNAGEVENACYW